MTARCTGAGCARGTRPARTATWGTSRQPVINVDASRVVNADDALLGAHRDIHHPEIATLILLAARLLEGSADGARPRRVATLFDRA